MEQQTLWNAIIAFLLGLIPSCGVYLKWVIAHKKEISAIYEVVRTLIVDAEKLYPGEKTGETKMKHVIATFAERYAHMPKIIAYVKKHFGSIRELVQNIFDSIEQLQKKNELPPSA